MRVCYSRRKRFGALPVRGEGLARPNDDLLSEASCFLA
jgi:hypothetical protein